jgi:predicted Ser/Thr protein kinase
MQKEILLFKKEIENPNTNINPKTKTILTVSFDRTGNKYNNRNYFAVIELLQCNSVSHSIDIKQTSRVELPS